MLAALASLILVSLSLMVLLPDYASACSRAGGVTAKQVVEDALSDPDYVVFSGEVVDLKSIPKSMFTATLRVSEVWKGTERGTLEVNTNDPAFCGTPFKEGQEYLVYAYGKEEPFRVDDSATKLLSKAGTDLALLGQLGESEMPTNGGDTLPDTSGGVVGLEVVGVAAVGAATAALLFLRRLLTRR